MTITGASLWERLLILHPPATKPADGAPLGRQHLSTIYETLREATRVRLEVHQRATRLSLGGASSAAASSGLAGFSSTGNTAAAGSSFSFAGASSAGAAGNPVSTILFCYRRFIRRLELQLTSRPIIMIKWLLSYVGWIVGCRKSGA